MSKKWTPELDSILLRAVFEECNIAIGKALCEKIASRIRTAGIEGFTECTPKAIENRLYAWKKKSAGGGNTESPAATPKKAAAKSAKEHKLKTPLAKKGIAKNKGAQDADATGGHESPLMGNKRKSENEEGGEEKKAKTEMNDPQDEEM